MLASYCFSRGFLFYLIFFSRNVRGFFSWFSLGFFKFIEFLYIRYLYQTMKLNFTSSACILQAYIPQNPISTLLQGEYLSYILRHLRHLTHSKLLQVMQPWTGLPKSSSSGCIIGPPRLITVVARLSLPPGKTVCCRGYGDIIGSTRRRIRPHCRRVTSIVVRWWDVCLFVCLCLDIVKTLPDDVSSALAFHETRFHGHGCFSRSRLLSTLTALNQGHMPQRPSITKIANKWPSRNLPHLPHSTSHKHKRNHDGHKNHPGSKRP